MTPGSARFALLVLLVGAAGGICRGDGVTDRQIERAAARSFAFRDQLNGRVSVRAEDGVVTLSGRVETQDERTLAEDTVSLLVHVRRVDNQIEVDGPKVHRSDESIALHVRAALLLHRDVSAVATRVTVRDGEVILDGHATTAAQKQLTGSCAAGVEGVRAVLNNLVVDTPTAPPTFAGDSRASTPPAPARTWDDPSVTAQVRYELLQRHLSVGARLHVATHDGIVTLSGEAANQDEWELIDHAARQAPGVRALVNRIHVQGQ